MPLDGTLTQEQQNLTTLTAALRGELPPDFTWNFGVVHARRACGAVGCAIGLAHHLGLVKQDPTSYDLADALGLPYEQLHDIVGPIADDTLEHAIYRSPFAGRRYKSVTPAEVAAALEAL